MEAKVENTTMTAEDTQPSEAPLVSNGFSGSSINFQTQQCVTHPFSAAHLKYVLFPVGLEKTQSPKAQEIAFKLAQKWVTSNFRAFKKYNAMFEKVSA